VTPPAVALLATAAACTAGRRTRTRWAAATALIAIAPVPVAAAAAAAGLLRWRARLRRRRLDSAAADADVMVLAELVGMGISAGLSVGLALQSAADRVHSTLRGEVATLLRRAHPMGLAAALASAQGRARPLWLCMARATVTGAPLAGSLAAFVATRRSAAHALRIAAARRLPIRLMLPVAMLILPGFVMLTLGPALLSALSDLSFPIALSLSLAAGRLPV